MRRLLPILALLLGACASLPQEPLALRHEAAELAYRDGQWLQAAGLYRELAQAVPHNTEFHFRLANSNARAGLLYEAAEAYREVLQRDPSHGRAWFNLGLIELELARSALEAAETRLPRGHPARARAVQLLETMPELPRPAREDER